MPLELSPGRWELAVHLLDAVFYATTGRMSVPFTDSVQAQRILKRLSAALEEGIRQRWLQTSPHLVLLDSAFYHAQLKPLLAAWLLLWLRTNQHVAPELSDADLTEYLVKGPLLASTDRKTVEEKTVQICRAVHERHSPPQRKMLNLAHDWLTSFAPHVLSKINRVSFGLLHKVTRARSPARARSSLRRATATIASYTRLRTWLCAACVQQLPTCVPVSLDARACPVPLARVHVAISEDGC